MKIFLDTSSLLNLQEKAFENHFYISYTTLLELENIKTSQNKSDEIKFRARKIVRLLNENLDKFTTLNVNIASLNSFNLQLTNDNIIVLTAWELNQNNDDVVFYTDDICLKLIAKNIFGLKVESVKNDNQIKYTGYKTVVMGEYDLANFYSSLGVNRFDCLVNEYLVIKDKNDEIVDTRKWDGKTYASLVYRNFKSRMFGAIKPLDEIQRFAFDSINNNEISVLYGRSGSGKTTIPLSYIMQGIETQKFAKCHIVYHFEPLKGAKTLGFEKGSHVEKLLNYGSLGNILTSKMGDSQFIEAMINNGTLNIIPTCNIRGVEFSSEDIVFVTEAQNLNVYTLKTIIQRCKQGCKQIYEGDILEQSDINCTRLGIDKMIDVFKGHDKFGCVKLKNNYRNPLCELADKMEG